MLKAEGPKTAQKTCARRVFSLQRLAFSLLQGHPKATSMRVDSFQTFLDRIVTMNLPGWRVVRASAQYDRRVL
jgi:hypothetical protein